MHIANDDIVLWKYSEPFKKSEVEHNCHPVIINIIGLCNIASTAA